MRDIDNSLGFNFSRFSSNGWQNFALDDASQDMSLMNKHLNNNTNHHNQIPIHFTSLLNEPPQPATSIYNCIQSQNSQRGSIKQVQYLQNEPQAKPVNSKQYFRMMKRRIKKVMSKFASMENQNIDLNQDFLMQNEKDKKQRKKYLYQSRHRHAVVRPRGKDGKFLATRPQSQRFRQKKKRGRKPKNQLLDIEKSQLSQTYMSKQNKIYKNIEHTPLTSQKEQITDLKL